MPENNLDLIKDIELNESIKLDNSVDSNIIEKTVNKQLEWLWNNFITWSTWYQNNLQIIENSVNSENLDWIGKIFENRLKENPDILKDLIVLSNLEAKKEEEIEKIILDNWITLNTENNLIWLQNELKKTWKENNEKIKKYKTPEELKKTFQKVDAEKEKKIENWPKIIKLLKAGKFKEAIEWLFIFIWWLFSKKWEIWLKNYENLNKNISSLWLDKKTLNELSNMIYDMNNKIENTNHINKKLKFTYILSEIKNKSHEKNAWKEMKPYDLLLTELQKTWWQNSWIAAWQVLLINKENKKHKNIFSKFWDGWLKIDAISDWYKTPFLHSVIVSKIEWNDIYIRHSTMNKKDWSMWVEEIKLYDLLDWYKNADILVMDMPDNNKEKMLKYSEEQLNKKYNKQSAVSEITWLENNNEWLNCVELISKWLDDQSIKWTAVPNKLLSSSALRPTYLTTI